MNRLLEKAVEQLQALPLEMQDQAARSCLSMQARKNRSLSSRPKKKPN
jgi:hypothetical protein